MAKIALLSIVFFHLSKLFCNWCLRLWFDWLPSTNLWWISLFGWFPTYCEMSTSTSRRGNFFGKDVLSTLDAPKSTIKDSLIDKSSRYDQENILNGLKNGSNTAIPDSYVGYSNIPNHVIFPFKNFEFCRRSGALSARVSILIWWLSEKLDWANRLLLTLSF